MPAKGRTDPAQLAQAVGLLKEMMSTKNQADFSEIADAITRKFGGAEGIANSLSILYQDARGLKQQLQILELVIKCASRKAEMHGGSFDAMDKAIPLLSDNDLEQSALSIMTRVMERKGLLDIAVSPAEEELDDGSEEETGSAEETTEDESG